MVNEEENRDEIEIVKVWRDAPWRQWGMEFHIHDEAFDNTEFVEFTLRFHRDDNDKLTAKFIRGSKSLSFVHE